MRHRFWGRTAVAAVAFSGLINFTACSSDGTDGDGTGGNGGGGGDSADPLKPPPRSANGSIFDDLGVKEPERKESYNKDVPSPYEDAAECKEFDSAFTDVHDCACDKCFKLQQQCDALQGCIEIAECGIEIGCKDANTCYLLASNTQCVPIIDKWGNTGTASAISLALSGCMFDNGCRK